MKKCPTCHAQYSDDIQFCVRDGSTLVPVGNTSPGTENPTSTSPSTKPNKGRNVLRTVLIVVAVLAVVFLAVSRHLNNAATYLRAEPNQITASKAGGEIVVDIDYDGYVWKINHKPDWVKVDEMDQSFSLTVQPNRTGQSREGSITVQGGKQLAQVIIRQNGMATKIQEAGVSRSSPTATPGKPKARTGWTFGNPGKTDCISNVLKMTTCTASGRLW